MHEIPDHLFSDLTWGQEVRKNYVVMHYKRNTVVVASGAAIEHTETGQG